MKQFSFNDNWLAWCPHGTTADPKIFFDGAFLHAGILQREEEVLVIGGKYDVVLRLY